MLSTTEPSLWPLIFIFELCMCERVEVCTHGYSEQGSQKRASDPLTGVIAVKRPLMRAGASASSVHTLNL